MFRCAELDEKYSNICSPIFLLSITNVDVNISRYLEAIIFGVSMELCDVYRELTTMNTFYDDKI